MLTNHPKSSEHPNIHEVTHGLPHFKEDEMDMFEVRAQAKAGGFQMFIDNLPAFAMEMYSVPVVKELYEKRKEFDLIVVDHMFNEVVYPFVHEVPFITIATSGMDHRQSAVLGNVLNPAYAGNFMMEFPLPMSVWHRFLNTIAHIGTSWFWRNWAVVPLIQKEISTLFPELPPLLELERNMSLALLNTHFSISKTLPLLPSQVEVGAMHCSPAKPLPQELEAWIMGAGSEGVIYFSLGSLCPAANDNVKVFITHGGLLSLQESIYHGKPLLVIPIYGDQPKNAMFVKDSGLGQWLEWEELTVDDIIKALTDIINYTKYKENVARMSVGLRDQLTSPKERAVFWTEYVIRHLGAPQLRCPAAQLSWVEFLMLDVLLLLLLTLLILYLVLRRIFRAISGKIFDSDNSKEKSD
ncbi:UDP-glycosyltransferase UGT5-like [Panulirus ornatus]|uniref:UDP-glycosyltransferase UGT5-like n=1 Tax=Panulirus ornatus TaxID=150431 RepID=UPI003A8AF15B